MVEVTYLSHSAFIINDGIHSLVVDPFLEGNPMATINYKQVKAEYIILTHAHGDHFGDTPDIATNNDATVIAVNELARHCGTLGLKNHPMHIGGAFHFPFGRIKFTQALHGSSTSTGKYMGDPAGVLITIGGKTIYHTGDTGIFSDMKLIGELDNIDLFLVPIGGNFTMDINDAAKAVEFVKPKLTVPMHYNTFPIIEADPNIFSQKVKALGFDVKVMSINETIQLV